MIICCNIYIHNYIYICIYCIFFGFVFWLLIWSCQRLLAPLPPGRLPALGFSGYHFANGKLDANQPFHFFFWGGVVTLRGTWQVWMHAASVPGSHAVVRAVEEWQEWESPDSPCLAMLRLKIRQNNTCSRLRWPSITCIQFSSHFMTCMIHHGFYNCRPPSRSETWLSQRHPLTRFHAVLFRSFVFICFHHLGLFGTAISGQATYSEFFRNHSHIFTFLKPPRFSPQLCVGFFFFDSVSRASSSSSSSVRPPPPTTHTITSHTQT